MTKPTKTVSTDAAPAAIGPYSQAVACDSMLFLSGQIGLDPTTMELVRGGTLAELDQVLKNLEAVLRAGGCGFADVVRTTVYLMDLGEFAAVNEAYARVFGDARPARATVQAAALPKGARVEIDCIARIPG
ncbi:MAG: RidA family protein [Planctomycetes bacterium]|nr:RidA family protein [Planctomycetota bacterium]